MLLALYWAPPPTQRRPQLRLLESVRARRLGGELTCSQVLGTPAFRMCAASVSWFTSATANKLPCSPQGTASWCRTRSMGISASCSLQSILSHRSWVPRCWWRRRQSCCASTGLEGFCGGCPNLGSMVSSFTAFKMAESSVTPNGTHRADGSHFGCTWIPVKHVRTEALSCADPALQPAVRQSFADAADQACRSAPKAVSASPRRRQKALRPPCTLVAHPGPPLTA
ncbi:hypothetical protein DES44_1607 [Roseateles depolymerans]|uniref:Uncharacterized protein n=1 Tax=Roseateles depolymerans TaxID=76731 RepID=A0A0U3D141_9BURK|nr:hypothetical protein RD2015_2870 [Roseateles depolymerans]REG22456.1 hypothetical protein DES44_1607 [Roseateles depolymerans]